MPRKINALKLTNKLKTTLRQFYNETNQTKFRNITEITRHLERTQTVAGADQAYTIIAGRFNDAIKLNQKSERARKAKEKRDAQKMNSPVADKKLAKAIPVVWDKVYPNTNNIIEDLQKISKKLVGKSMVYMQYNAITGEKSFVVKITSNDAASIYWNILYTNLFKYIDGEVVCILVPNSRLVVLLSDTVIPEKLQQKYRDGGEKHCVIDPIYNLFMTQASNSVSSESRKKLERTARQIKNYEEVYPDGVPEEDMHIIGKASKFCIVIHDILGNEVKRFNSSSNRYIRFTNTRANHLEYGNLCLDQKPSEVSQEEINNIIFEHNRDNIFYLLRCNRENDVMIKSSRGCWTVENPENQIMEEFSKSIDIRKCSYDALKYPQMNALILESRIVNAAPTPLCSEPNNIDGANHIDLTKAYTQHKLCPYYSGFMGVIHQWRRLNVMHKVGDFLENHLGIFQFKVTSRDNEFLNTFGIFSGKIYSLPSVEILYFIREFKMTCILTAGCWGSRFDFDYSDEMLENRRYCSWAGKNGMQHDSNIYTFKGDAQWCAHLKTELGNDNVFYFAEKSLIACKVNNKVSYTRHHILAFITSYTRINMFEIMRKIPSSSLIKVMLDGLYFRGEVPDITIPHKCNKELKTHLGFREFWYYPSTVDVSKWPEYKKDFDGRCVLAGAGGTGKTHTIMTDRGFINMRYIVPMHTLGVEIRDKYSVNYDTMHKFIGKGCVSRREETHNVPSVILIDELTMHDGSDITKAIEMYPECLIFVAGDIDKKQWFQCRNGTEGQMNELWMPQDWRYVFFEKDFRSLDNELRQFKLDVREQMRLAFTDGGLGDAKKIKEWVVSNYSTVKLEHAVEDFKSGNIWIAGTHATNKKLLEKGVLSGYIKNKQIIYTAEGADKRGSFTTHSFQGLTISDKKVFISMDNFEYAMFYTAISRVRNFTQLVFVV